MAGSAIDLLLTDLDGVVRHFDRSVVDRLERDHDLEVGSLRREAFEHPRGHAAITGGVTRAEWIEQVGVATGSPEAAREWLGITGTRWGRSDRDMVELIRGVRRAGVPVAVLTNGTDTIDAELSSVGLTDAFDAVFCSWHLGQAKPDPEVFDRVCAVLEVDAGRVVFVDDSQANVEGARQAGLIAHTFTGVPAFRATLADLGLPLTDPPDPPQPPPDHHPNL